MLCSGAAGHEVWTLPRPPSAANASRATLHEGKPTPCPLGVHPGFCCSGKAQRSGDARCGVGGASSRRY